jgi:hypothetical protein
MALATEYGGKVEFIAVLQTDDSLALEGFLSETHNKVKAVLDTNDSLAEMCGVYSTPQAVLLDARHSIYYRGNYNKSRFCKDRDSRFADLALRNLIQGKPLPDLPKAAFVAYGCSLPKQNQL